MCLRTRSGTVSLRICSKPAPICARSRFCWAMPSSPTPLSTCICPDAICRQFPVRSKPSRCLVPTGKAFQEADQAMSRPTLEVADIIRAAGQQLLGTTRIASCMAASQGARCHRAMPNCGTGRSSRSVCPLRPSGHLVQLMPQPALSPSARATRAPSGWPRARAELLPVPYFHIVFTLPHELSALVLQNKRLLYDLLFRASAATLLELGARSEAPGSRHRFSRRAPHLGTEPSTSSARPLRRSRWRTCTRWLPMDPLLETFLPARRALSRVFRGKFTAGLKQLFHQRQAPVPRLAPESC